MRPTREAHRAAGRWAARCLPALAALAVAAALATAAAAAAPPAPAPEAPAAPDEPVERPGTYYPTGIEPPSLERPALVATSVVKVVLFALLAVAVFYVVNWTLLDTRFVDTSVLVWGMVVLGGGVAGLAAVVLVPLFYLGFPLGLVLFGGAGMAYAVHRNALVTPPLKVLTSAHVERVRRRLRGEGSLEGGETGPVSAAGRDIIFVGLDDLPRRPAGASAADRLAGAQVERVLHEAIVRRASVLGYVSRPQKGEVRFRIDGEMVGGEDVPHPASDGFAGVVKHLAGLDPREVRRPQEGRLRAVVGGQTFDLRIK
ncbi:MAG: hypothetical protein IMZ66_01565, partial [Planctomycetes bacterium]|nr:hypothetical protein [Planctomycetota bacterium]